LRQAPITTIGKNISKFLEVESLETGLEFLILLCKSFFISVIKIPEQKNLKEKYFILVHSFRDFSPWMGSWLSCFSAELHGGEYMVEQSCSSHGR
jgi:hypothetical protein